MDIEREDEDLKRDGKELKQPTDTEIAHEAAVDCMASAWGYFKGGSAGASPEMDWARNNQDLGGPKHVTEERFLPIITIAIKWATAEKDKRIQELEEEENR